MRDVSGLWTFTASLRSAVADCLVGGVELSLIQTDSTFSGQSDGGTVVCVSGSATDQRDALPRQVINGLVTGDSVSFNFNTVNFSYTGRFQDDTAMFGTAVEVSPSITATGLWRASRK